MMTQRTFIPGSKWLYFKIYTGHKTADEILSQILLPYVQELQRAKHIDNFFFIRYADPEFHIRLRLHVPLVADYGQVFAHLHDRLEPCVENSLVSRIMCDTYHREIERYGEKTIIYLEDIFRIDSYAIMELISRIAICSSSEKENVRWQVALILLDDTLTAFGYNLQDKVRVVDKMAENFKQEFRYTSHAYTKQLNDKYRTVRGDVERSISTRELVADYEDILQARRNQITEVAYIIKEIFLGDNPIQKIDALIYSIQHMTMNRWFRANNRQHELVIHDFMSKYYESASVREKKGLAQ